jgi:hypothetical protein
MEMMLLYSASVPTKDAHRSRMAILHRSNGRYARPTSKGRGIAMIRHIEDRTSYRESHFPGTSIGPGANM